MRGDVREDVFAMPENVRQFFASLCCAHCRALPRLYCRAHIICVLRHYIICVLRHRPIYVLRHRPIYVLRHYEKCARRYGLIRAHPFCRDRNPTYYRRRLPY